MKDGSKQSTAFCAGEEGWFASDLCLGWIWIDFHGDNKRHLFPLFCSSWGSFNCDVVSQNLFQKHVHKAFYRILWLISASTWSFANNWLFLGHVLWLCFTPVQNNWRLRKSGGPDWKMWLSLTLQHLGWEWMRPHSMEQEKHRETCIKAMWFLTPVSPGCQWGEDTGTTAAGMLWYINPKVMQG